MNAAVSNPTKFGYFDTRYSSQGNPVGSVTVVGNSTGLVQAICRPGKLVKSPSAGFVLQVPQKQESLFSVLNVGDSLNLKLDLIDSQGQPVATTISVGPQIMSSGKITVNCNWVNERARPRAAVGWDDAGKVWLVSSSAGNLKKIAGTRAGGSSVNQLAVWLKKLGAKHAALLDGGGSVCMFINSSGKWNRLDEPLATNARALPNAIGVYLDK